MSRDRKFEPLAAVFALLTIGWVAFLVWAMYTLVAWVTTK